MRRRVHLIAFAYIACALSPSSVPAEDRFLLNGGETIVFFGDSITQNGGYVNYFEAYLLTRFPDKSFRVINHGISSETISGTTEEDHDPPRPWALPRFERDVAGWKPDVVVACFGMNDGNYYPFEPVRFQKYQDGVRELIRRVKEQTKAKLVLMTPPPYDPYRRRTHDPDATTFGYKFAAIDYDRTLAKYSQWLVSLRKEGQTVVDLHSAMNEHLRNRRKQKVSFSLSPDAVHPDPTGHWLMAQHLLLELHAPSTAAELTINVRKKQAAGGDVKNLTADIDGTGASFTWTAPLPMPWDEKWDAASIELERVASRLNRYRLGIAGLKANESGYRLIVKGKPVAAFGAAAWEEGVDLWPLRESHEQAPAGAGATAFPANIAADKLLSLVKERRRLNYAAWRATIADKPVDPKAEPRVKELTAKIEQLRKPQALKIRVQQR